MAITPDNNQAQLGPIIPNYGLIYLEVLILSFWMVDIDTLPMVFKICEAPRQQGGAFGALAGQRC